MWVFADFGAIMPAEVPAHVLESAKNRQLKLAKKNGWNIQVRGRIREHLEYFAATYLPTGTYSPVYETKGMDYNVRLYTTREALGAALSAMAMDIDYSTFKETAKRYSWGDKYYKLLLRVWGTVSTLARPYAGEGTEPVFNVPSRGKKRSRVRDYPARGAVGSSFFGWDDYDPDEGTDDEEDFHSVSIHSMTDEQFALMEEVDQIERESTLLWRT